MTLARKKLIGQVQTKQNVEGCKTFSLKGSH